MAKTNVMQAWTDYPIQELGDAEGVKAPVRECAILSYDGNKYCRVVVAGVPTEIKAGYLYRAAGRCGEVPKVRYQTLLRLQPGYHKAKGKPAQRTVSYVVYEPNYRPGGRYVKAKNLKEALTLCRRYGPGSKAVRKFLVANRNGASRYFTDPREFLFNGG